MAMHKDLKKLLKDLEEQGATITTTTKGHLQVRDANNRIVAVTGSTPSDHRSLLNFKAQLRRAGYIV